MADTPQEPRVYEKELEATLQPTATLEVSIATRALDATQLAVLGILVTIALGSAALASGWWQRLVAGLGAFAVSAAVIRVSRSRRYLMTFVQELTGS